MVKVEQLENKNQFVIHGNRKVYFQSYKSVCACVDLKNGKLTLYPLWDCSKTTRKHLYIFMNTYWPITRVIYAKNKRQEIKKND